MVAGLKVVYIGTALARLDGQIEITPSIPYVAELQLPPDPDADRVQSVFTQNQSALLIMPRGEFRDHIANLMESVSPDPLDKERRAHEQAHRTNTLSEEQKKRQFYHLQTYPYEKIANLVLDYLNL